MRLPSILSCLLILLSAITWADDLENRFRTPDPSTRPGCYWYWINDNISKEGITKDLEAMARVGIGRAYIGHIYNHDKPGDTPVGNVKFMSDAWWDALQWAVKEAGRCGVDIGFFNSPGWSQSGGPWIQPSQSMRYLAASETPVSGGKRVEVQLPVPAIHTYPEKGGSKPIRMGPDFTEKDFQQVSVIAFPKPIGGDLDPKLFTITSEQVADPGILFDNNPQSAVEITDKSSVITVTFKAPASIQSLQLDLTDSRFLLEGTIESSDDGATFKPLIKHSEQRGHQGPRRADPLLIALPPTTTGHLRITLSAKSGKPLISELRIGNRAVLNHYVRKQLGETSPATTPKWETYTWEKQATPASGTIDPSKVIDLTGKVDAQGVLRWEAPAGEWVILRSGMLPIGTGCHPTSPESQGLEVDKMSKEHIRSLFDGMVGEFLRRTAAEDRKALKYVIADSYETGPQNWTDGFIERFTKRYGYSPAPYLPCIHGHVVGSTKRSNRFLWDWRRLIAESIAEDYVGGLRELCHENGLTLWLENYGHWGFPSEFLYYGGMTDQVGGEFWESATIYGNTECRSAASAAHTYGHTDVYAEAFTSNRNFKQSPAELKSITDWVFASGINHLILHVNIHQPDERKPGIIQWFGTAFNRHNTWFNQSKPFIDYIRRCGVLLKAGRPVSDIAYYIGQSAPVMTGPFDPALPNGYDFDHINADVLIHRAKVVDGRLCIDNGPSYSLLVLPNQTTMTPEVAQAVKRLVSEGATILGPKPLISPSLAGYPDADKQVVSLTDALWTKSGDDDEAPVSFGKGRVFSDTSIESVMSRIGLQPDVTVSGSGQLLCAAAGAGKIGRNERGGIVFKHRSTPDREIYFLANTSTNAADFMASFRISGRQPRFWNALNGQTRDAVAFTQKDGRTEIPIHLEPSESVFVVFDAAIAADAGGGALTNYRELKITQSIQGPWKVSFDGVKAPQPSTFESLSDWTRHEDERIKHFSGTATYETTFECSEETLQQATRLDLGQVGILAAVTINGVDVGTLWTTPWSVDVTKQLKAGTNTLQIRVTSTWNNRLVGDAQLPADQRETYVSQEYRGLPKTPLLPSGLIGPVTLKQPK